MPANWLRAGGLQRAGACVLVPAALSIIVIFQAHLFHQSTSATWDEPPYLHLGLAAYHDGHFADMIARVVPPLPILLANWLPALLVSSSSVSTDQVPGLVAWGRLAHALLVGVPLVLVVYGWLARRHGWAVGLLGGLLLAFSPTLLAHSSVAATDACFVLFALVALALMCWYAAAPGPGRYLAMSGGVGLAVASKQSAVFLFPVALVLLTQVALARCGAGSGWKGLLRQVPRVVAQLAALVALAFAVSWACYGFATAPLLCPGAPHPIFERVLGPGPTAAAAQAWAETIEVPASLLTVLGQFAHGVRGHSAFLCGERSDQGWWYFFPVAFTLKSTIPELVLALATGVLLFSRHSWRDPTTRLWLVALVIFSGLVLGCTLNLGHRYILRVYPLLVLCAVDGLARWLPRAPLLATATAALLLAVQAASAWSIAPQYLSYFNALAGGPEQGHRYLVDSSLDWGQDLPALRAELDRRGSRRVLLAYFGTDSPQAYGIRALNWREADEDRAAGCDCVAISATVLQGVHLQKDYFSPFRKVRPTARAGYSIFLYDTQEPAVQVALAELLDNLGARPMLARRK